MSIIILHQLEAKPRTMFDDGSCIEVKNSAFIGATDDELCQFGIGLLDEEGKNSLFWGLLCPELLITAWRGVHILDKLTNIFSDTICRAYYAGMENEEDNDVKKAITALSEQLPDFGQLRKSVLSMKIDDETLDAMLKICNSPDNHIDINVNELKAAVQAGTIHQTAEVSRAYQIAIDEQLQRERDEKISKQPLPEAKSFRQFCERCGINNLFDNPYDDWPGYRLLENIDEVLVYRGLRYKGVEEVWCTEHPQHAPRMGHIGQPVLQLNDQRTVVLAGVRFRDNDMWGAIRAVKSKDKAEWLTLSTISALEPKLIGLTFDRSDKPTPEDMQRGYLALQTTKNPLKKIMNAIMPS